MNEIKLENIELKIKVKQLELEVEELKKELANLMNSEVNQPKKENEIADIFKEVEQKIEQEEIEQEEIENYTPLGSSKKRDKEILISLSYNNGLNRDQIIRLFFKNLKTPVNTCNSVMKRLYRDGHVKVDKNQNPYKYYSKHNFKKPCTEGYVYFIKEFHSNTYKIGKAKNIEDRLRMFNVKLPFEWELFHSIKTSDYTVAEKLIQKEFASKRIKGSEWFELDDNDLKKIKENNFLSDVKEYFLSA